MIRLSAPLIVAAAIGTLLPAGVAQAATGPVASDFNGDGYRDVAIPAPHAAVGNLPAAGAAVVLYGSASGVPASRRAVITQNSPEVPSNAETGDAAEAERSAGVGRALLTRLEERARELGCHELSLDSGTQRTEAHRFYFRERLTVTAFHFDKQL